MKRELFKLILVLSLTFTIYFLKFKHPLYNSVTPMITLDFAYPTLPVTIIIFLIVLVVVIKYIMDFSSRKKFLLGFRYFLPVFGELAPGHICIYGATGSGKTTFTKRLVRIFSKNIPVMILDWHGEYALDNFISLRPGENFSLNPLAYYQGEISEHIEYLVDLFGDIYKFSEPQRYMFRIALKRAFSKSNQPTLTQILEIIEAMPLKSYWDYEIKMAIKRRLSVLVEGRIGKAFSKNMFLLSEIFNRNVIINLSVFRSIYVKKLFTMLMLKILYDYVLLNREITDNVYHITVIEESWNIIPYRRLDAEPTVGERLFAELRKYGEFIVSVSQFPSETAWSIMKNARMLFVFRIPSKEGEIIAGANRKIDFSNLSPGTFFYVKEGSFLKISLPKALIFSHSKKNTSEKMYNNLTLKIKMKTR